MTFDEYTKMQEDAERAYEAKKSRRYLEPTKEDYVDVDGLLCVEGVL